MLVMKSGKEMEASASASASASAATPPAAPFMSMSPHDIVCHLAFSNAVVIFSSTDCCMSTVAKRLLFSLGVGPAIIELDEHAAGSEIHGVLCKLVGSGTCHPLPAVFIGGKFLGGVQTLLATHIDGTLVPLLKEAGALWL